MQISILGSEDFDAFWALLKSFRFDGEREHYECCLERHEAGELSIVCASLDAEGLVGFCLLNRQPKYALFRKCGLAEVQDLNVLPVCRRQGIGQALVQFCEDLARHEGRDELGIGVGMDSSFGAAQRLYTRMGYIPDGSGVSYDRIQVAKGEFRPVDENLCLMMTKIL